MELGGGGLGGVKEWKGIFGRGRGDGESESESERKRKKCRWGLLYITFFHFIEWIDR